METKSRYEVISDLEEKKRELIRQRNELAFESNKKERLVLQIQREKENLENWKQEFEFNQEKQKQMMGNEKTQFEFKFLNTKTDIDRRIEDAEADMKLFTETLDTRKKSIEEQIVSIDENLQRFGQIHKDK